MKKIILLIFIKIPLIIFLLINFSNADNEITIELQIANEIITNIDFAKEQRYLVALNNNLKNLPKNQFEELAKDSLIREKIKKNELLKFYNFNKIDKFTDEVLKEFYEKLNFTNQNEFELYLKDYNLKISDIKNKLKIETLWNELIFKKFNNQIKINTENIKKKIKSQKNIITEYNLSEILFELKSDEKVNSKYNLIIKNIEKTGFKNNANIFSLSDTSKFGGEIGWISQTHLNESLLKEIELLNINEISKPIQTSSGYLIIKLNDKRKKELKFDKEKLYNRMIVEEKNRQLNQFSLIYFKKIKQNIFISEK
jgi:peptidyl-prolyl cis-trans isomerase SurA